MDTLFMSKVGKVFRGLSN